MPAAIIKALSLLPTPVTFDLQQQTPVRASISMSLEPPEDRIYTLTGRAIAVSDSSEIEEVMAELRAALKEHPYRTRATAISTLISLLSRKTG